MIWLFALFSMLQAAPAPERASEDQLIIHYPRPIEAVRCVNRLRDEPMVQVTVSCRVTAFGRATDCEPQDGVELGREQRDAMQCMTRKMRFTDGNGALPKPTQTRFTVTLAYSS